MSDPSKPVTSSTADTTQGENRLRGIIDASPFPIALVDTSDDKVKLWSRSAVDRFGHNPKNASEWYQLAYPDPEYQKDVVKRWKPALEEAARTGQTVNTGEYRVVCADGSVRLCELYARFYQEDLIITFNDITERKQTEERIQKSEHRSNALLRLSQMSASSMQQLTELILEEAIKLTDSRVGYLGYISDDEKTINVHSWTKPAGEQPAVHGKPLICPLDDQGLWSAPVRQRKPIITNDVSSQGAPGKSVGDLPVPSVRHACLPVFDGERITAVVGVGDKDTAYSDEDMMVLTLLMDGLWKIIARKRVEENLHAKNQELEDKLAMIEAQRAAIAQMSTPIIQVWDEILCLPVVGMIDTARSSEMTDRILEAVVRERARAVIVDITGIEIMDTKSADHFVKMAKAVRLLGSEAIITGISPGIAQTLTQIGVELSDIRTLRSLRDALRWLLESAARATPVTG